jgi:hypothetical protein
MESNRQAWLSPVAQVEQICNRFMKPLAAIADLDPLNFHETEPDLAQKRGLQFKYYQALLLMLGNPIPKIYFQDQEAKVQLAPDCSGVFATRPITKSEVITFFPAHLVFLTTNEYPRTDVRHQCLQVGAPRDNSSELPDGATEDDFFATLNSDLQIWADPAEKEDPRCLAHYIRDAARLAGPALEDQMEYLNLSATRRNAHLTTIQGLAVAAVAAREIEAGEQVFLQHGLDFWLEKFDL